MRLPQKSRRPPLEKAFQKIAEKKAVFFDEFERKLANLARQLGDGPFFFGSHPLFCDLNVYHVLSNARLVEPTCLDGHRNVTRFMEAVEGLPRIREYLARRPTPVDIGVKPNLDPPVAGSRMRKEHTVAKRVECLQ